MSLKSALRSVTPPLIYSIAHRARRRIGIVAPPPLSFSPRATFADAILDAGNGYGDNLHLSRGAILTHEIGEMQDYAAPILASIGAMAMEKDHTQPFRVLDFGGGSGFLRVYVDYFFGQKINTKWRIVETPEQVRHNIDHQIDGLEYSTSIGAEPYDFAIFSGSLQYVDDWAKVLRDTDASAIYVSRTPMADIEQPFLQTVVREGQPRSFAGRVISAVAFANVLSERYSMFASWQSQSHLMDMGVFQSQATFWKRRDQS